MTTSQAKPFFSTINLLVLTAALFVQVSAHPFYKYYIVAEKGGGTEKIENFDPFISINDKGLVALIGRFHENGTGSLIEHIFVGDGTKNVIHSISPTFGSNPYQQASPGLQINNNDQIVVRRAVLIPSPIPGGAPIPVSYLERWDARQINTFARAKLAGPGQQLAGIYGYPSVNDIGAMAYGAFALVSGKDVPLLGLVSPAGESIVSSGTNDYRPMYANNGTIAIRLGFAPYPLFLFDEKNGLTTPKALIAGQENGFTYVGQSPGISDDGSIVTFYGERATAKGIFFYDTRTQATIQVTGQVIGNSGIETPPGGYLGTDNQNNPASIENNLRDSRISVTFQEADPPGPDGDTILLFYLGTPNRSTNTYSAKKGAWVSKIKIESCPECSNGYTYIESLPQPVFQVGDSFRGSTITDINLYDSIANTTVDYSGSPRQSVPGDHQIVFWLNTDQGERIVRGLYLDSDSDGLPDHWETQGGGIDVDEDTIFDLNLASFGARPDHKDIFLEIDYMDGEISDLLFSLPQYKPLPKALSLVTKAFLDAPKELVGNPDGLPGINLHIDSVQEKIPEAQKISFYKTANSQGPHFQDLKAKYFGNDSSRQNQKTMQALKIAYRYCIFGHSVTEGKTTGIADLFGDDLMVLLPAYEAKNFLGIEGATELLLTARHASSSRGTAVEDEWADMQAGTLMHELGHTLGLQHGGRDPINYKPNYFSVMNYSFQFNNTGCDIRSTSTCVESFSRRRLDYSRSQTNELYETNLDESQPIAQYQIPSFSIYTLFSIKKSGTNPFVTVNPANIWLASPFEGIDWDGDGQPTLPSKNDDINSPNQPRDSNDPEMSGQKLISYKDWSNLHYSTRDSILFGAGAPFPHIKFPEGQKAPYITKEMSRDDVEAAFDPVGARITPTLTSINPPSSISRTEPLTLEIAGEFFYPDSVVTLDGKQHQTIYLSAKILQIKLSSAELSQATIYQIGVTNLSHILGEKRSNTLPFMITTNPPIAPPIAITKLDPKTISAGEQRTLTIEATLAPSEMLLTNSVTLLRYNDQDALVSNLGQMFDDGTHGDRVAGDKIFTTQIVVQETTPQTIFFKASAAFKGQLKRLVSLPETLTVTQSTTPLLQRAAPIRRGITSRQISPRP